VNLGDLGTPAQLWRRWVLMSAGHAALELPGFEIRRSDGCAHLEDGSAWLRMRRLAGNRAVIWGHHPDVPPDQEFHDDLLDNAPDWSYEVDSAHAVRDVAFLGWYAHGSWSSVPGSVPSPVARLLAPLGSDDQVAHWWRTSWPDASPDQLDALLRDPESTSLAPVVGSVGAGRAGRQIGLGRAWSTRSLSDAATAHLRSQIHLQMRSSLEIADRGHPARPALLRQWARINVSGTRFRYAVCAASTGSAPSFVPALSNNGLPEAEARSLENVLMELRMTETDPKNGAWLFAKVTGDGRTVSIDRSFDTWPAWYVSPGAGPTMAALHAEMVQRAPKWRPSWSTLIPADRF
jgi:hypothetical protein